MSVKSIQHSGPDGEITVFQESVYRLVDAHVQRYVERGFTSLMFCFGCTGGQHRSVYSDGHRGQRDDIRLRHGRPPHGGQPPGKRKDIVHLRPARQRAHQADG